MAGDGEVIATCPDLCHDGVEWVNDVYGSTAWSRQNRYCRQSCRQNRNLKRSLSPSPRTPPQALRDAAP